MTKTISIGAHCIPASDLLARLNRVVEIPPELAQMESETGGGLMMKLKAVVDSRYFYKLPKKATIKAGANPHFHWVKKDALTEANRILGEVGLLNER